MEYYSLTNRKPHTSFEWHQNRWPWMTLNDVNGRYFALFYYLWANASKWLKPDRPAVSNSKVVQSVVHLHLQTSHSWQGNCEATDGVSQCSVASSSQLLQRDTTDYRGCFSQRQPSTTFAELRCRGHTVTLGLSIFTMYAAAIRRPRVLSGQTPRRSGVWEEMYPPSGVEFGQFWNFWNFGIFHWKKALCTHQSWSTAHSRQRNIYSSRLTAKEK